jgi:hypothetical protein
MNFLRARVRICQFKNKTGWIPVPGQARKSRLVKTGAILAGRHSGGSPEGNPKTVHTAIAAFLGNDMKTVVAGDQQCFATFNPHLAQGVPRIVTGMFQEGFLKAAQGHGGYLLQVLDADRLLPVCPKKTDAVAKLTAGDASQVNRKAHRGASLETGFNLTHNFG